MFVTTLISGFKCKNEASLSSASTIKYSLDPKILLFSCPNILPPIINVGSNFALIKISAIKLVVVVLPCEPATAML